MRELQRPDAATLAQALEGDEPVLLPGLVAHWPLVQAARQGDAALIGALRERDLGATVGLWAGPPEIEGRFGYDATLQGFNFERRKLPLRQLLDLLAQHAGDARPPALYMGSTTAAACLRDFAAEQHTPADALLARHDALASLWLGNRTQVSLHQDLPDNLACVAAGRRRFMLLPPDAVADLYIGPLEHTLAGQPTSLVDHEAPDLTRYPRFARALERAVTVELEPGDALYVPSLWWHGVTASAPLNLLVNHWWRRTPAHLDSPFGALLHTLMTVRALPPAQRAAWRALFDHYVFDADEHTAAHIPPAARGVLGELDDDTVRGLRLRLIRRLNR